MPLRFILVRFHCAAATLSVSFRANQVYAKTRTTHREVDRYCFEADATAPFSLDIIKQKKHLQVPFLLGGDEGTLRSNRPLLALRAARSDCFRSPAGQNAPQERFVSPGFESHRQNQTQRHPSGASVFGGDEGTRTPDLFDVSEAR